MADIREKVLATAIKQLEALGCLYHILDYDGNEHGFALSKPAVADDVQTRRPMDRKSGEERSRHLLPYLLQIKAGGDPVDIPIGPYSMDDVQGSVGSRLARAFGPADGNYVTSRDPARGIVQVLLLNNPNKMGEAEAIAATFHGGRLAGYAEDCLDVFRACELKDEQTKKKTA